jgi:AmpD protein
MKINTAHWLTNTSHIISPNFDDRSDEKEISLIVIHCISLPPNEFGTPYISQLFCNQLNPSDHPYFETIYTLKVSAHSLIRRDGEIIQYVPFNKRAWHAGQSSYQGRERCNDFSIGIELEGTDTGSYSDKQYQQLAQLISVLLKTYPKLSRSAIVGHSDIAPQRKTDPGSGFDWQRLFSLLDEI